MQLHRVLVRVQLYRVLVSAQKHRVLVSAQVHRILVSAQEHRALVSAWLHSHHHILQASGPAPWNLLSAWWQPILAPITNSGNHCQHIILFCLICLFYGADDVETRDSHMIHACSLASFSYALTKAFFLLAWFYYINRDSKLLVYSFKWLSQDYLKHVHYKL